MMDDWRFLVDDSVRSIEMDAIIQLSAQREKVFLQFFCPAVNVAEKSFLVCFF